uniref:Uncharacterized protein n=1 Tax=Arcella intermedia TaxID=1963864 RepID=A0A6B2KWR0_9EUKA
MISSGPAFTGERPKPAFNPFSSLLFWPVWSLLAKSWKTASLQSTDLWDVDEREQADYLAYNFERSWNEQRQKPDPSLFAVLVERTRGLLFFSTMNLLIAISFLLMVPVVLPFFFDFLENDNHKDEYWGWIYGGGIILSSIVNAFLQKHAEVMISRMALRIMTGLQLLIFKKMLRIPLRGDSTGKIIGLVASDTQIVGGVIPSILIGIIFPVYLALTLFLLYRQVEYFAFVPVVLLILIFPVSGVLGNKMFESFDAVQERKDERLKYVNELINYMRIVKYYAWERVFNNTICGVRIQELSLLKTSYNWTVALYGMLLTTPNVSSALTIVFYGISHPNPSISIILTSLNLMDQLRTIFAGLPTILSSVSQFMVCLERIREFLLLPELEYRRVLKPTITEPPSMEISGGNFRWTPESEDETLKDINIKCSPGTLTMVVGSVGSGKSSLIHAFLGEMIQSKGDMKIIGELCYVPQTAWIFNETVQENILFGKPFSQLLFKKVIKASGLGPDLKIMSAGRNTEIGEHGVNLSGGQKQRIAIARALYSEKDIYIFDDSLSAVDAHVGQYIFEHTFRKFLKDKCVLLITNQLQYLPYADNIVMLDNGKIVGQGNFSELENSSPEFKEMTSKYGIFNEKKEEMVNEESNKKHEYDESGDNKGSKSGQMIEEEEKEEGKVSWSIYKYYFLAAGPWFFLSMFFLLLQQGGLIASAYWLQFWPNDVADNPGKYPQAFYVGVYSGLNVIGSIFLLLYFYFMSVGSVRASNYLHDDCLTRTIRAPISFFDVTPIGRILSRFSTDMTIIDSELFPAILDCSHAGAETVGVLITLSLGAPFLLAGFPLFGSFFWKLQDYFRKASIQMQRLEALSRAPMYSYFSEILSGTTTVRAWGSQERCFAEITKRINNHSCDWFAIKYAYAWFGLYLAQLGNLLQLFCYVYVIVAHNYLQDLEWYRNHIYSPGLLAITLTYAPSVVTNLRDFAKLYTVLETQMNSVERIKQYVKMPTEADPIIEGHRPPPSWPSDGNIEFKRLKLRYRPNTPVVLWGITCKILPGEKIGIVGRTGAGKSSLLQALFRMAEPDEGKILIDGIDIASIGLEDLRSKLSIIPQEPVMFIGTIRYNLDPAGKFTDEDLWQALELANLANHIKGLANGLEEEVLENGSNFSVGQRQLFCMARVLLQKPKILLMDEATASVDIETDQIIQTTIRRSFADANILVIAHRLNTVMDLDRIMVLDKGRIIEFDSPRNLVKDPKSYLNGMIEATGPASAAHLRKIALGGEPLVYEDKPPLEQLSTDFIFG